MVNSDYSINDMISEKTKRITFKHFSETSSKGAPLNFKQHDDILSLGVGNPNPQHFPTKRIIIELDDYPFQGNLFPEKEDKGNKVIIEREATYPNNEGMDLALQYGRDEGNKDLLSFVRNFVEKIHKPVYPDWSTVIDNGSADGLSKAAYTLINEGDIVLVEEFTFSPFFSRISNNGGIALPVKLDFDKNADVDLQFLQDLLENWDEKYPEYKGKKPKAFYTIPAGQNPTGLTQSLETRKKIYALASKHNFVIIEDDPYGYLALPPLSKPKDSNLSDEVITSEKFFKRYTIPSYLHLDTEGRVIRIETFSKVFAPGIRLGFIVAPSPYIEAINKYSCVTHRAASGLSQLILNNIISQKFNGIEGWLEWIAKMITVYTHRRNVLIYEIVELEAYKKGFISLISCDTGMFAALRINLPKEVDYIKKLDLLNFKFLQYGVNVVLGYKMAADVEFSRDNLNFIRVCFASLDDDKKLITAGKRLSQAVNDFFENNLEY